ncbi:MAG TPA: HD domain-containing phosphohydrolase, partial [Longimicrobiaceae bacterium]|nr:HD domain-containing phosphohydrolase [Longimicrobiaceae bacterium]
DDVRAARALNGLGILHLSHGDLAQAEDTYLEARETVLATGHARTLGEIEQNLGIIATIRGDHALALERYREGLRQMESGGHLRGIASALANLGMLHVGMGRLEEADEYLGRSLEICEQIGDVITAGNVHLNRTELFLARGDAERARASCDEAYETFSRLGEAEGQAEAMKCYGIIHRTVNKLHLAENYLRQGIRISSEARYPLGEAESHRELALVLRELNRNREALEALNRAHSLFVRLQAEQHQADISDRISKLESDFLSLVRFWGESIEAKDRYTGGHCERVAAYACRLAAEVGLSDREMVWFRMGAFLHDLGKTEVPEEILNKPGRLTDEERRLMERHPVTGDEILAPVEFPWDIRPMVRSHHERWDGRGYPDGLAAASIPFAARILRIADIFDALTTARSYRRPLSPEEALRIMVEDEGSFDPEIFAVFHALFPELVDTAREAGARVAADSSL